jgi:hypothetical protein
MYLLDLLCSRTWRLWEANELAHEITGRVCQIRDRQTIAIDPSAAREADMRRRAIRLQSETENGQALARRAAALLAREEAEAAKDDPPEED